METGIKEKPKKNKYSKDVLEKVKNGESWIYPLKVHPKIALKLVEEIESNPSGGEYQKLINNILAKHYKIKIK